MAKKEVILTIKTYVDGVLVNETAEVVKGKIGCLDYAFPAIVMIGIFITFLLSVWG